MNLRNRVLAGVLALGLAVSASSVGARRAEAAVGIAFLPVGIGVLCGWLAVNAVHAIIRVSDIMTFEAKDLIIGGAVSAGIGVIVGVILLDGGDGTPQFQGMSPEFARSKGINEAQRLSFNANLEEINSISQEMGVEVTKLLEQGAPADEVVEHSRALTEVYGAGLPADARGALSQLAARAFAE